MWNKYLVSSLPRSLAFHIGDAQKERRIKDVHWIVLSISTITPSSFMETTASLCIKVSFHVLESSASHARKYNIKAAVSWLGLNVSRKRKDKLPRPAAWTTQHEVTLAAINITRQTKHNTYKQTVGADMHFESCIWLFSWAYWRKRKLLDYITQLT